MEVELDVYADDFLIYIYGAFVFSLQIHSFKENNKYDYQDD